MQRMEVIVPAGIEPGGLLQVDTAAGPMRVQLPADVGAGMPFAFMVPSAPSTANKLIEFVGQRIPDAKLEELEPPSVTFTVPTAASSLSQLFAHLADARAELPVTECSVTQCTLEQIFITMASKQGLRKDSI